MIEWWESHFGQSGAAHSVSTDQPPSDVVAELRKVVEEVTRKPCPAPEPRKIGFL